MPREASPAFQFYPQDFLSDHNVMAMNAEQRGIYIVLLCHCWLAGSIPKDGNAVRRLALYDGNNWPRAWAIVGRCFRLSEGVLINPRIERERQKQAQYRKMKAAAGQAGGRQKASRRLAEHIANPSPPSSSSSSSSSSVPNTNNKLVTSSSVSTTSERGSSSTNGNGHQQVNGRSKRPIFTGQRFVVFDWMLEDMRRILGPEQLDKFDVHEWFFTLDARVAKTDITLQRSDVWPWLQSELVKESVKRGIPLMSSDQLETKPKLSKQTQRLVAMIANARDTL